MAVHVGAANGRSEAEKTFKLAALPPWTGMLDLIGADDLRAGQRSPER